MKSLFRSFVEGFFVLLPVLIAYLMLGQLFDMMMALTQPIIDVLPTTPFPDLFTHRAAAAGLLVIIILLVGLAAHTRTARRFGDWFERNILTRFPPYNILKSLAAWISGKGAPDQLHPALFEPMPGMRMLVAVVEELPEGDVTIFVPLAPTPGVGFLQIVKSDKIQKLDAPMTDALGWFLNWGAGTEALLKAREKK